MRQVEKGQGFQGISIQHLNGRGWGRYEGGRKKDLLFRWLRKHQFSQAGKARPYVVCRQPCVSGHVMSVFHRFFGHNAGGAFHLGSAFIAPTQSGEMSAKTYGINCGLSKEPLETQRLVSLPYVVDWDSL